MPTPQKVKILEETSERLQGVRGVYLADFSGMDVEALSLLRRKCREQKVQFRVVKNTLLKRAFHERGITALDPYLEGPTGLVFSPVSEVSPAKILTDFAKDKERPRIKAAVVDGRLYDHQAVAVLATLPSYEAMLSQVLTGFLAAIDATLRLPATMADVLGREKSKAS